MSNFILIDMQAASLKDIKDELKQLSQPELMELCLRMARYKKENKELLTYALFLSYDENEFRVEMKEEIDEGFSTLNTSGFFLMKKTVRKVLRNVKQAIRYSKNKETEADLLMHFCKRLKEIRPSIFNHKVLENLYYQQLKGIHKAIDGIEPDLQRDYQREMEELQLIK